MPYRNPSEILEELLSVQRQILEFMLTGKKPHIKLVVTPAVRPLITQPPAPAATQPVLTPTKKKTWCTWEEGKPFSKGLPCDGCGLDGLVWQSHTTRTGKEIRVQHIVARNYEPHFCKPKSK